MVLNEAQIKTLNKWLLVCKVYSDNYLISIDFKYIKHAEKLIYLSFFESLIVNDAQLKKSKCVIEK